MKITIIAATVFLIAATTFAQTSKKPQTILAKSKVTTTVLTAKEREQAVQYLKETKQKFLNSINGLTAEQWNFKPAPERWSIAEVAEHIGIAEQTILGMVQTKIVKSPGSPEMRAEAKGKDEIILKIIPNRAAGKAQAPEILKPVGKWKTQESLIKDFNVNRTNTVTYVSNTKDALRDHFAPHPVFKTLDAYQWLLFLAAHSERHTAQIIEVKNDPNFPKN
ncbi:MAG: DinB family protein [Pyrinomonadaceae bacterium]|nr:DinB family protein [Pyrinomonadaceae bacterium]